MENHAMNSGIVRNHLPTMEAAENRHRDKASDLICDWHIDRLPKSINDLKKIIVIAIQIGFQDGIKTTLDRVGQLYSLVPTEERGSGVVSNCATDSRPDSPANSEKDSSPTQKELERLDKLEEAAWKGFAGSSTSDSAHVDFLRVVHDAITKRIEIQGLYPASSLGIGLGIGDS